MKASRMLCANDQSKALCTQRRQWWRKQCIGAAVAAVICVPCLIAPPVLASDLFDRSCAGQVSYSRTQFSISRLGCHVGGGNIVGGRTLKLKDLEAENVTDVDSLSQVIGNGRRRMPGFGQSCTPQVSTSYYTENAISTFRANVHLAPDCLKRRFNL